MKVSKFRVLAAAALFSASFALTAFAISKEQQAGSDKCWAAYQDCVANVCTAGRAAHGEGWYGRCTNYCYGKYTKCMDYYGLQSMPKGASPTRVGGLPPNPTPTPRKGPVGISGLPESNATPTPRKGPGKAGTLGMVIPLRRHLRLQCCWKRRTRLRLPRNRTQAVLTKRPG